MAEKKGVGHAYNVDFLNVVFAVSSLFLFLSVIWMVWDDYDRGWKNTQRRFAQLEYEVTQAQLQQASRDIDSSRLKQLRSELAAASQGIAANQQSVDELQAKIADADNRLFRATTDYQAAKATWDQNRYDFEASRNAGAANAPAKGERAAELERRVTDLNLALEKITAEKTTLQAEERKYIGQADAIDAQLDTMTAEESRCRNDSMSSRRAW